MLYQTNVTFQNCHYSRVLFYKCPFDSILFENNVLEQLSIYLFYSLCGLELSKSISTTVSSDLQQLLNKAILHKYIRESNTIFKKVRNTWPQDVKRELKKIKKKGLKENSKRKAERKKLQQKNYQDTSLGINRKLDPGINTVYSIQHFTSITAKSNKNIAPIFKDSKSFRASYTFEHATRLSASSLKHFQSHHLAHQRRRLSARL